VPDTSIPPTAPAGPPIARREPQAFELHGQQRVDDYAWLRDQNWREVMREPSKLRADIRQYLEAENAWTRTALENPTEALQAALFEEMKGRIKEDDASVPAIDGPWAYYRRFRAKHEEGGEYPLLCRRPSGQAYDGDASVEQIMLDGDAEANGLDYYDIRRFSHSPDHRLIAWTVDDKGSEAYTLRIRDLQTGADLVESIPDTYGEFVWSEDSAAIYWVSRD
jgi:oligopeptidase B